MGDDEVVSREIAPLFMVTGAPGAGKTSVLPHLVAFGAGRFVVADMDEILNDGGLLGVMIAGPGGEPSWPAYNELWARVATLVRRSGTPMVLLSPLEPAQWPGDGGVVWIHLDCSHDERRRRLAERHWDRQAVEAAVADARSLRSVVPDRIATDGLQAADIARQIADRVARAAAGRPWTSSSNR